jgi:hypothetical protein
MGGGLHVNLAVPTTSEEFIVTPTLKVQLEKTTIIIVSFKITHSHNKRDNKADAVVFKRILVLPNQHQTVVDKSIKTWRFPITKVTRKKQLSVYISAHTESLRSLKQTNQNQQ